MDANRKWYKEVRSDYVFWLDKMNTELAAFDNEYYNTPGKKAIARINNNLMFHPHKPVYKDYFGAALDKSPNSADFYIEIGLRESMLAGGFWRPDAKTLRSIRDAVDYDGEEFKKIITKKSFVKTFGSLYEDEKLKTAPKGFSRDHTHIDLLRNKTFAVIHRFKNEEVLQHGFGEKVIQIYKEMLPFRRYLNQAVTV
jgi:uncharacterized protein (TIGR02453 family)